MDLNKVVKNICREIGVEICGITNYESVDKTRLDWLETRKTLGYDTEFEEDDLKRRLDKNAVLENANSIIVIGLPYNTGEYDLDIYPRGKLSRSSYGEDYHIVVKERLEKLKDELLKFVEFDYKIYADTGPLIDRELAYQAGLGYYGKNCSIINEEYGSFIFIGYMLTNLNIREDEQVDNQCGSCTLCLEACPTKALYEPYRVNAKKCVSYLTQSKEIDENLIEKIGSRVYGCDTCQDICPKNRYAKKSKEKSFIPVKTRGYIDIVEFLKFSNKEFKEKYGSMAGSWRGKNTLKRNCIIVLENLKDDKFLDLIDKETKNESDLISKRAKKAIEKIEGEI